MGAQTPLRKGRANIIWAQRRAFFAMQGVVDGMPGRKPVYCLAQDRAPMYGSAQNISRNRVYQMEQGRWFFP